VSIILVRHGETALNAARVLQPPDTPLSARGREQARALAARLASMPVAGVLSSDYPRALETARMVAAACGVGVDVDPFLRERDFGALRGQPIDSLSYDPLALIDAPPGGESMDAFEARVASAFARVLERRAAAAGPLVVVTHGLVIAAMLRAHAGLARQSPAFRLGNTSMTVLGIGPPCVVELLACTRHLEPAYGDDRAGAAGG
jgi:2,3-bisphosphoglycerate-dependent phosphoglycerate mutase